MLCLAVIVAGVVRLGIFGYKTVSVSPDGRFAVTGYSLSVFALFADTDVEFWLTDRQRDTHKRLAYHLEMREFIGTMLFPLWDQAGKKVITVTASGYDSMVILNFFELKTGTATFRQIAPYSKVGEVHKILRYNQQHPDHSIRYEANRIIAALRRDPDSKALVPPALSVEAG